MVVGRSENIPHKFGSMQLQKAMGARSEFREEIIAEDVSKRRANI